MSTASTKPFTLENFVDLSALPQLLEQVKEPKNDQARAIFRKLTYFIMEYGINWNDRWHNIRWPDDNLRLSIKKATDLLPKLSSPEKKAKFFLREFACGLPSFSRLFDFLSKENADTSHLLAHAAYSLFIEDRQVQTIIGRRLIAVYDEIDRRHILMHNDQPNIQLNRPAFSTEQLESIETFASNHQDAIVLITSACQLGQFYHSEINMDLWWKMLTWDDYMSENAIVRDAISFAMSQPLWVSNHENKVPTPNKTLESAFILWAESIFDGSERSPHPVFMDSYKNIASLA